MVFIVVTLTFHFFQNLLFMNSVSLSKYHISLLFIFTPTLPLLLAIYLFYLLRLLVFIVQQILSKSSLFYCNWYFSFILLILNYWLFIITFLCYRVHPSVKLNLSAIRPKGEWRNGFYKEKNCRKSEHFLPLIRTSTCAHQEVRNIRFSENLMCFVFL